MTQCNFLRKDWDRESPNRQGGRSFNYCCMSVFNVRNFSRNLIMSLEGQPQKIEAICRRITEKSHYRTDIPLKGFYFRVSKFDSWIRAKLDCFDKTDVFEKRQTCLWIFMYLRFPWNSGWRHNFKCFWCTCILLTSNTLPPCWTTDTCLYLMCNLNKKYYNIIKDP